MMHEPICKVCRQPVPLNWAALHNPETGEAAHLGCEAKIAVNGGQS